MSNMVINRRAFDEWKERERAHLARIEALEAERDALVDHHARNKEAETAAVTEVEQLRSKVVRLGQEVNMARYGQPDFAWSVHVAAMERLQSERDALVEATKLTVPIAALTKMLAEARAKGMEEAAGIAKDADLPVTGWMDSLKDVRKWIAAAIRARAAEVREKNDE